MGYGVLNNFIKHKIENNSVKQNVLRFRESAKIASILNSQRNRE